MKIEMTHGASVVDVTDLGDLLEPRSQEVQTRTRSGDIASRFEAGDGVGTGEVRSTFLFDWRRDRLIRAEDGPF